MKFAAPVAALLFFASCQSAPPPIPDDAAAQIYFQRAQAATDESQYDDALKIYRDFMTKQPNASHEDSFSARYEIALLLMKKNKYPESQADFESIVADYEDLDKSSGAPAWVKILSQKMLQEVKDKLAKPKLWFQWWK